MILKTVHGVGDAVVTDIDQDKDILAADRVVQDGFSFTGSETRTFYFHQIVIFHITMKSRVVFHTVVEIPAEIHKMAVYFLSQWKSRFIGKKFDRGYRHGMFQLFCIRHFVLLCNL